ncbi:hypothetical protein BGZ76_001717 [Entomortierella beljakovae]|nr:hypothetical protein BGZ76_001717 [Entomortierella beljakovae]
MEPGSCSNSSGRNMNSIVKRQATILQLKSKIHLGLVDHSPQNISTIAFVIHNIHILQHVANRLSGLVRLELTKDSKKPDLNFALQFISTHKSHFSTLNEIKIMAQNISDKSDLSSLVHAMGEPRVIDVSRWINGNEYLSKFPLQVCRVLLMGLSTSSSILGLEPNFLAKLSKLHTLRIFAFHQDMFANTPDLESVNHTTHSHPEESSLHQIPSRQMQLPNRGVISVCLNGPDENLVPALKDACDTSRWTLKRLSGTSNFIGISNPPLSWTWLMPCLTYLELEGTIAVNFNLDSLVQCPQLYELILNIGRQIPQTWDVVSKAAQLAKVSSRLRLLDLSGWWALPDSALLGILFPVLTRLKKLDLMFCTGPSCGCILELLPKLSALEWFGVPEHYTESEYNEIKSLKESLNLSIEIETLGKK